MPIFELYVTVPDHTKSNEEIRNGALHEEFVVETNDYDDLCDYLKYDKNFDILYGDFTELRIVRKVN